MTWSGDLIGQLDFYWKFQLWPRLAGLTDEEYLWEPAAGAWSVRPTGDGGELVLDFAEPEPPNPPVTTIAWRSVHVGRDVLGKRARAFFGPTDAPDDADMYDDRHWPEPLPGTAAGALELLDQGYQAWRDGVAALDDEAILQPLGSKGGLYAKDSMAALALHLNREVIAHGAELCLLRDLYRAQHDHADPVVAAGHRGDAAEIGRLVDDGAEVRPTLLAEVAGRRHWDVVRALVTRGVPVGDGVPSALHFAAGAGESDVVDLLLEHGADATVVDDRFQQPPAGWADYFGHPELAARLRGVTD